MMLLFKINKNMKRYATSLVIREIKLKTTMRYHLIPIRMATIKKKTENNKCWKGCKENVEKLQRLYIVEWIVK